MKLNTKVPALQKKEIIAEVGYFEPNTNCETLQHICFNQLQTWEHQEELQYPHCDQR